MHFNNLCTWCGEPHDRRHVLGHIEAFCSDACHNTWYADSEERHSEALAAANEEEPVPSDAFLDVTHVQLMQDAIAVDFDDLGAFLQRVDEVVAESDSSVSFFELTASYAADAWKLSCASCGRYTGGAQYEFCCRHCEETWPPLWVMVMERDRHETIASIPSVPTNAWDRLHLQHSVLDAGATTRRAPSQEEEQRVGANIDTWYINASG